MVDIRDRRQKGIILRARDYKEQDRLLTLVNKSGPQTVIAKGARKSTSSLRAVSQSLAQVDVLLSPAKDGISFLKEGLCEKSFLPANQSDLARFAYGAYIAELLLSAWPSGKEAPELYALLLATLNLLLLDDDLPRTTRFFELRLLQKLGLLPELTSCSACGKKVGEQRYVLHPAQGALLCASCASSHDQHTLAAGTVQSMRCLLTMPLTRIPHLKISATAHGEMDRALSAYLCFHLDYPAKAKKMLQQLS